MNYQEEYNPYQSTNALTEQDDEYNTQPFYVLSGRIGRMRYLAYSIYLIFCSFFLTIMFTVLTSILEGMLNSDIDFEFLQLILQLIMINYAIFIPTIRRLNDLNCTGWSSILLLFPGFNILLCLYLMFVKGTEGVNDYGMPAKSTSIDNIMMGILLIALIVTIITTLAGVGRMYF